MNISANGVILLIFLVLNFVSLSVQHRRVKRIVGGQLAAVPPPDDPVVFTTAYNRNARIEGYRYLPLVILWTYSPWIKFSFFLPWEQKRGEWFVFIFGHPIRGTTDWPISLSSTAIQTTGGWFECNSLWPAMSAARLSRLHCGLWGLSVAKCIHASDAWWKFWFTSDCLDTWRRLSIWFSKSIYRNFGFLQIDQFLMYIQKCHFRFFCLSIRLIHWHRKV